ncbi:hypothetical protein J6590_031110 [Homalodisca vitripennis]|nr:hypothetical protein J6590_031110 [Homalodisca vitripennis]
MESALFPTNITLISCQRKEHVGYHDIVPNTNKDYLSRRIEMLMIREVWVAGAVSSRRALGHGEESCEEGTSRHKLLSLILNIQEVPARWPADLYQSRNTLGKPLKSPRFLTLYSISVHKFCVLAVVELYKPEYLAEMRSAGPAPSRRPCASLSGSSDSPRLQIPVLTRPMLSAAPVLG